MIKQLIRIYFDLVNNTKNKKGKFSNYNFRNEKLIGK